MTYIQTYTPSAHVTRSDWCFLRLIALLCSSPYLADVVSAIYILVHGSTRVHLNDRLDSKLRIYLEILKPHASKTQYIYIDQFSSFGVPRGPPSNSGTSPISSPP